MMIIFKLVFFLLMVFSMLMSFFSKPIISIFAAPEYIEAYRILPILLLSVMLSNASGLVGGIFMAMKQSKYFFYSSIFGAIVSVVCTLWLVKEYGVYGVAWAAVASFMVMTLIRIYFVWKDVNSMNIPYYVFSIILYILFIVCLFEFEGVIRYILASISVAIYMLMNKRSILSIVILLRTKL